MNEKDLYARKAALPKRAPSKAGHLEAEDAKSDPSSLAPMFPSSRRQTVFPSVDIPPNCFCGGVAPTYSVTPTAEKAEREPAGE